MNIDDFTTAKVDVYKFENESEFECFVDGMKRWTFIQTIKLMNDNFKTKNWAKPIL